MSVQCSAVRWKKRVDIGYMGSAVEERWCEEMGSERGEGAMTERQKEKKVMKG